MLRHLTAWPVVIAALGGVAAAALAVGVQHVPRLVLGLVAGASLGLAGALLQGLTRNPIADPGLLGINAGASLAVVVAMWTLGVSTPAQVVWFAVVGALVAPRAVLGADAGPVRQARGDPGRRCRRLPDDPVGDARARHRAVLDLHAGRPAREAPARPGLPDRAVQGDGAGADRGRRQPRGRGQGGGGRTAHRPLAAVGARRPRRPAREGREEGLTRSLRGCTEAAAASLRAHAWCWCYQWA